MNLSAWCSRAVADGPPWQWQCCCTESALQQQLQQQQELWTANDKASDSVNRWNKQPLRPEAAEEETHTEGSTNTDDAGLSEEHRSCAEQDYSSSCSKVAVAAVLAAVAVLAVVATARLL